MSKEALIPRAKIVNDKYPVCKNCLESPHSKRNTYVSPIINIME